MNQTEFDRFAHNYRKIHNHNLRKTGYTSDFFAERKVREIARQIPDPEQNLDILDLGCGDGLCSAFFREYFANSALQGLDVSRESILSAARRNIPGAQFKAYDGSRVPFKNGSFDIILLAGVLHHVVDIPNQIRLLDECHRVLKKEGRLFVFEHNPLNPITRKIVDDCPFDKNAKLISHFVLKKMLLQNGFQTRCRFIIFLPAVLKKFIFLEKWIWWVPIGGQYYYICLKKNGYK